MPDAKGPVKLNDMLREELKHIRGVDVTDRKLENVFQSFIDQKLNALCFSGGGIRSATFGLGVVQALAKKGLLDKFDYLSTVSGGGYLGSWLSAWTMRERLMIAEMEQNKASDEQAREAMKEADMVESSAQRIESKGVDVDKVDPELGIRAVQKKLGGDPTDKAKSNDNGGSPNPEPRQLQYLREYSNYMSPRVGLFSADMWALIGIYLRNFSLNLTIFIPLIAAVLLIPRFFYSIIRWKLLTGPNAAIVIGIAVLLGAIAIAFILNKQPSRNPNRSIVKYNTDGWVFLVGVLPFVLMALALSGVWISTLQGQNDLLDDLNVYGLIESIPRRLLLGGVGYYVIGALVVCGVGYAIFRVVRKINGTQAQITFLNQFSTLVACVVWGVVSWFVVPQIFVPDLILAATAHDSVRPTTDYLLLYVCFSVPVFLLTFLVGATVFVGISSRSATDEDREWLARYGAWMLIVCVVWITLNAIVMFGPIYVEELITIDWNSYWDSAKALLVSIIGVLSGVLSLFGGFSSKSEPKEPPKSRTSLVFAIVPKIAAVVFLMFIFVGISFATTVALRACLATPTDHSQVLAHSTLGLLGASFLILAFVGIFMAAVINVNKFSLHGAYRDRLVRAYLGASNIYQKKDTFTGFDDEDNFQLHRLKHQKPFHIINATLNLVGGKHLAWQNRKAASFTMSPLHCGSWILDYRRTNEYCRNTSYGACAHIGKCNRMTKDCPTDAAGNIIGCKIPGRAIRLGTAMAISGAAANPNMGYYSTSIVTFLMALFNIRLGWWLGNTGVAGSDYDWFRFGKARFFEKSSPSIAIFPLINETLGRTNENNRFLNVTDGGHFENLALYEMVLRRCKFIVLSDAAADEEFTFSEISNAIQKCYVDLGVKIVFKDGIDIFSREDCAGRPDQRKRVAVADIIYPEKDEKGKNRVGKLIYLRPSFYGDEPTEVLNYADLNKSFPHQTTSDQFFDEKQFEAYRALGFHIMDKIIAERALTALQRTAKKAKAPS